MSSAAPSKFKLTHLTVTKLNPAARPYLVWDRVQRGLVPGRLHRRTVKASSRGR